MSEQTYRFETTEEGIIVPLDDASADKLKEVRDAAIDPATASIEELETEDQLVERKISTKPKKQTQKTHHPIVEGKGATRKRKPKTKKALLDLAEKHAEHNPSWGFQKQILLDLLKLSEVELREYQKLAKGYEVVFELYPLLIAPEDLTEFRRILIGIREIGVEREHLLSLLRYVQGQMNPQAPVEPSLDDLSTWGKVKRFLRPNKVATGTGPR